jgi:pimeloyl-ACP methyl ester carboxylesterase
MGATVQIEKLVIVLAIALAMGCSKSPTPVLDDPEIGVVNEEEAVKRIGGTENDKRKADVIFIHGLGGNYKDTWSAKIGEEGDKFYWPMELSKVEPDVGVWSINYNASPSLWIGTAMPIEDRADNLLKELELVGIGDRPVIFVCHSLGGLVTKQMLMNAASTHRPAFERIVDNTRAVVFLATPSAGSDFGEFLWRIAGPAARKTVQVEQLNRNSPALRTLSNWYMTNAPVRKIRTELFFENDPVPGFDKLVVPPDSAMAGATEIATSVDGNHFTICKPKSTASLVFKSLQKVVKETRTAAEKSLITLAEFSDRFNEVKDDPARLADFNKDFQGKRVKWKAIVCSSNPDEINPYYYIAEDLKGPPERQIMAGFDTIKKSTFQASMQAGTPVLIEGTIRRSATNGASLEDCELIGDDSSN